MNSGTTPHPASPRDAPRVARQLGLRSAQLERRSDSPVRPELGGVCLVTSRASTGRTGESDLRLTRSVCLGGTPTVPQWGTHRTPMGHAPCPIGSHTVSQRGTDRVPAGYPPCPTGAPTVSQRGTHRVPAGYPPCPSGARTVSQCSFLKGCRSGQSGPPRTARVHRVPGVLVRVAARTEPRQRGPRATGGGDQAAEDSRAARRHRRFLRRRLRRRHLSPSRPQHRMRNVEEVVNPARKQARPGSMTVMKNLNASQRAVAIVNQALDVLQRASAPSPPRRPPIPSPRW